MSKFIIIDDFIQQHQEIEAATAEEAAEIFANSQNREKCLSPNLVKWTGSEYSAFKIPGEVIFADEGTHEGWGRGCKFEGQNPQHQLIFRVIQR